MAGSSSPEGSDSSSDCTATAGSGDPACTATVACSGSCACPSSAAASSGSLTDGSGSYGNDEDCSWVITASGGSISISFPSFSTESGYDYVYVYSCESSSGATSCGSSSELAKLSGSSVSSSSSWTSTSGIMRVRFTSDGSTTRSGFEGQWQVGGGCQSSIRLAACRAGDGCCRVEVFNAGEWGTVCDDGWGDTDANVVCASFSCSGGTGVRNFGGGTGRIWLDEVGCSGSEASLAACPHNGWGSHNCGHSEDAGACCAGIDLETQSCGTTPVACPSNANAPSGSATCLCNQGYTGPDGGPCQACGAGTYKDSPGSGACTACQPGRHSSLLSLSFLSILSPLIHHSILMLMPSEYDHADTGQDFIRCTSACLQHGRQADVSASWQASHRQRVATPPPIAQPQQED